MVFRGAEANIADAVQKIGAGKPSNAPPAAVASASPTMPAWQQALTAIHLPLYDVHWTNGGGSGQGRQAWRRLSSRVGLADGRILPLNAWTAENRLQPLD